MVRSDLQTSNDPASTGTPITTYFVNSSVLGKNISEVEFTNGSETKRRTNIWAGSAVIAEQRKIGGQDVIIYLHADPVTGSKVETSQSGQEAIYIGSNQVYEPLGQTIRRTPPFQEPPPPNPPPILNDSKAPEWQCTLYSMMGITEAKELPANCSIAAAERSIWERSPISPKQKGNPSKINPVDSPIPGDGPYWAGGQTLAYALGAAKKRGLSDDGEDASKKPVQDIGQFDAGTIYASDDTEAVAPELDSSFVDASRNLETKSIQERPLPNDAALKEAMLRLVASCKEFLHGYLGELEKKFGRAYRNDVGDIDLGANFDRIGIKKVDSTGKGPFKGASSSAVGLAYEENGKRAIAYRPFTTDIKYASVTLAELIHHSKHSGRYGDAEMDEAMKKHVGLATYNAERERMEKAYGKGRVSVGMVSHSLVNKHCQ